MRAVFIAVLQDGCPTCQLYKDHHEKKLIDLVKRNTNLAMITYKAKTTDDTGINRTLELNAVNVSLPALRKDFHPDLLNVYWKWWPNMMLFSLDDWNNHNNPLKGISQGGIYPVGEELQHDDNAHCIIAAEELYEWVVTSLNVVSPTRPRANYDSHKRSY